MSIRSIGGTFDFLHKKKKKRKADLDATNEDESDDGMIDGEPNHRNGTGKPHTMSRYEKRSILPTGRKLKDITRIRNKANTYSGSFSIIGLTRIFTGNPIERVFWFLILVVAIFLGFYMSWELTVKYVKKNVRTDTSTVITSKNIFPTVTICVEPPRKKTYCGKIINKNPATSTEMEQPCPEYKAPNETHKFLPITTSKHMIIGPFKLSCQLGETCDSFEHLHTKYIDINQHFHSCLVWNHNGDFYNDENRMDIEIEILSKEFNPNANEVRIFVDEKGEYLPMQSNYLSTTVWQHYQLSFKKTVKERLPAPYTSKCVKNIKGNIFPGHYTLAACMESMRCIDTFKKCGDSYDFCKPFIPADIRKTYYKKKKSRLSMHECLYAAFYKSGNVKSCALPCKETVFDIYGSGYFFNNPDPKNKKFRLSMRYEEPYMYTKQKEKELYSWGDFLGGVGGNIGLFCGFSMLSLVEIVSFLLLRLYAKGATKRLKRKEEIRDRQEHEMNSLTNNEQQNHNPNTLV